MLRGLKLWSVNTGVYPELAQSLYDAGRFDYLELYVVPGTLGTLQEWRSLRLPVVIHAPHFKHGFNLALPECAERNRRLYAEAGRFADALEARYIIFHGGTFGCIEETARQLAMLDEPRALIENKPCITRNDGKILECRGSTPAEIRLVMESCGCGFCLDIPHALCAANYLNREQDAMLEAFNAFHPAMYHLADMMDTSLLIDDHTQLGQGGLDMSRFIPSVLGDSAMVTIETTRRIPESLEEFERELDWLQPFLQRSMVL